MTVDLGRPLAPGDRLVTASGAVADAAGNTSAGTPSTAITAQASPRITSVLMSSRRHSANNTWTVPAAVVGGAAGGQAISITARGNGDAAGAAGDAWEMNFDRASTYSSAQPLDVDVRVDTLRRRVNVRFDNGPATATLGDLLDALAANDAFDARFTAGFAACASGDRTTPLGLLAAGNQLAASPGGGRIQFAIQVNFNAYVDAISNDDLLTDVLTATAVRTRPNAAETLAAGIRSSPGALRLSGGAPAADAALATTAAPRKKPILRCQAVECQASVAASSRTGSVCKP